MDLPDDLVEGGTYTVEITDGFVYDARTNTAGVSFWGLRVGASQQKVQPSFIQPLLQMDYHQQTARQVSVGTTLSIEFENPIIAKPTGPFSQLVIKNDETVVYTYGSGYGQFFKGFDATLIYQSLAMC